jgi:RimJ/RimL family protein N-acetyltransferase
MPMTKGNLTYLTQLKQSDFEVVYRWFSDKEVIKYSLSKWQKKHSKKQIKHWLENIIKDKSAVNFGIIEVSTKKLIGYAGISGISKLNNSGEYFIFIGDKNSWGKGYGTEVTRLVVNYGFRNLHLHRIFLTVSEPNIGGVKAYTKAGFKKEGILRDAAFRDGKYDNKIMMSILDS